MSNHGMDTDAWTQGYRAWIDALPREELERWLDGLRLRRFLNVQITDDRPTKFKWSGSTTFQRGEDTKAVGYYIRSACLGALVWRPIPRHDYLYAAARMRLEIEDEKQRRRIRRRWRIMLDMHSWSPRLPRQRVFLPLELAHHVATLAGV